MIKSWNPLAFILPVAQILTYSYTCTSSTNAEQNMLWHESSDNSVENNFESKLTNNVMLVE